MGLRILAAVLLLACPLYGQNTLSIETKEVTATDGEINVRPFGSKTLIEGELPKGQLAQLLTVIAPPDAGVSVVFEADDRTPIEAENVGREYLVTQPGRAWYYAVIVSIVDGKPVIEQERGAVIVGEAIPVDPPVPVPDAVRDVSEAGARALSDKPTAANLITNLKAAADEIRGSPLPEAKQIVKIAINRAMMARPATNQKDWLGLWRTPVNSETAKLNFTTTEAYRVAVLAMIQGLEDSLL